MTNVRKAIAELLEPIINPVMPQATREQIEQFLVDVHGVIHPGSALTRSSPPPSIDSAALQFALFCVQRERDRLSKTAIIDPMADRAMAELERLISSG